MPRPKWKGKHMLNIVYNNAVKLDDLPEDFELPTVRLYRRNVHLSASAQPLFVGRDFELYNGYDFISKNIDKNIAGYNLSTLVSTREVDVVHKTKQTKHQRKNAALLGAKKKMINVSKMKNKQKKKQSKKTK